MAAHPPLAAGIIPACNYGFESSFTMIGVTGATGFLGNALCIALSERGQPFIPLVRKSVPQQPMARVVGDIGPATNWNGALIGLDCIVHCAAHVHQMGQASATSLADYRRVNTLGTLRLAKAAWSAGTKRFVFISSIKVMGEVTESGRPFNFDDTPAPTDPYGISKWEAEQGLWDIAKETGLEVVVVRPPLIYGPGVGANFRQLMTWVARGIPLPVGSIKNQRSLVSLTNLTDLILKSAEHAAAPGNTFLVSDGQDLSTPALVSELARAMGKRPFLIDIPIGVLQLLGKLTGRTGEIERLTGNLQVNIKHTQSTLAWAPICSVEQGMRLAVQKTPSL
jgi:nucleoside-diphosphate-sugar epimerase